MTTFSGKHCAVVGLGKTGLSCVEYLTAEGATLTIFDDDPGRIERTLQKFPQAITHPGQMSMEQFANVDYCVVSPGVNINTPFYQALLTQGVDIIGDIEIFARVIDKPVVGITGSNAKGTVTTLLGAMAECAGINVQLGGNIGIPVLPLLADPAADLYVLELSSFQLETTSSLNAQAVTILNISPDHLDRYNNDIQQYAAAKQRIFAMGRSIVFNRDDVMTQPPTATNVPMVSFGLDVPAAGDFGICQHQGEWYLAQGSERLLAVTELKIQGAHNWSNALAALALGSLCNLPMRAMCQALREFSGLAHRCQLIGTVKGVQWINDSKATNIGATIAALRGIGAHKQGKLVLLAGGQGKQADFTLLREALAEFVDEMLVFGQDRETIAEACLGTTRLHMVAALADAVQIASEITSVDDIVLLSPACASFDMFDNFEHRGAVFTELVHALAAHCK